MISCSGLDKAVKYDDDKPRTDLLPSKALIAASTIFGYGEEKYTKKGVTGEFNYKRGKGLDHKRVYASTLRHLLAYNDGEDLDQECHTCGTLVVQL